LRKGTKRFDGDREFHNSRNIEVFGYGQSMPTVDPLLRCRRLIGEEGTSEAQKSCRGPSTQSVMMQQMQQMMDGMMWGMGLGGLIVLILVALAIAALVKYIFFR